MITLLRRLRHGPLRRLGPVWLSLGRLHRWFISRYGFVQAATSRIGPYGPFKLDGLFAFSDFENWGGGHNDAFTKCIGACRGKQCLLDVGAHIGLVALPAASVMGRNARIICFEPAAANRKLLLKHASLNGFANIEVVASLVGAQPADAVRFFEMDGPTGMNTVATPKDGKGFRETACAQVSLDAFCGARGIVPDVIKIDVEGAEIGVLRGAREILAKHRPLIFLSVHPREIESLNGSLTELKALIDECGYSLRDARGAIPERFELREYVLTPRERAD